LNGLDVLVEGRDSDFFDEDLFIPCLLMLMEAGCKVGETHISLETEFISIIKNRIIEITFMKKIIFEKWNGRIGQAITDFTMEPCLCNQNTSLQNLSNLLNGYAQPTQIILPSSVLTNYCVLH
jgi:hypothetical protein